MHYALTAVLGVYLLAASLQGWLFGPAQGPIRIVLLASSLLLISGGLVTDLVGIGTALLAAVFQLSLKKRAARPDPLSQR